MSNREVPEQNSKELVKHAGFWNPFRSWLAFASVQMTLCAILLPLVFGDQYEPGFAYFNSEGALVFYGIWMWTAQNVFFGWRQGIKREAKGAGLGLAVGVASFLAGFLIFSLIHRLQAP